MTYDETNAFMTGIATGALILGLVGTLTSIPKENRNPKDMGGGIIPVYAKSISNLTSRTNQSTNILELVESTEPQVGLIKLLADRKGEALAITGNGDGTTSTNYFGNIHDTSLMDYIKGEQIPTIFVDNLPKYGAQQ